MPSSSSPQPIALTECPLGEPLAPTQVYRPDLYDQMSPYTLMVTWIGPEPDISACRQPGFGLKQWYGVVE